MSEYKDLSNGAVEGAICAAHGDAKSRTTYGKVALGGAAALAALAAGAAINGGAKPDTAEKEAMAMTTIAAVMIGGIGAGQFAAGKVGARKALKEMKDLNIQPLEEKGSYILSNGDTLTIPDGGIPVIRRPSGPGR